jgi:tryptophan 2,3-dioxygenase
MLKPPEQPNAANQQVQDELFRLYKSRPDLVILFENMTDFDEGLQEWRYRHVKLVERTIGAKHGTGGSLGVEFLKKSLFLPVFADLWAIRHRL